MKPICLWACIILLCTGCWDTKEINQLAIVNLGGVDKNPETGTITAYYQVINPSGLSARLSGGQNAAVYTFHFKEYSLGKFTVKTNTLMPRQLFMPHMQAIIVTERYAKQGVLDLLNYYELSPERRSNIVFIVTESPLSTIMNSYTPLDRIPGRYIRSLTNLTGQGYTSGFEPIRMRDMIKSIYRRKPTVMPTIKYTSNRSADTTERLEEADVNKQSIVFTGGAVFIHGRMVGRFDIPTKLIFSLLNGDLITYVETVYLNGSMIDLEARDIQAERHWESGSGLTMKVHANLRVINNQQNIVMSEQNLHAIEEAFNKKLEEKAQSLLKLARQKNWDLLGLQDQGVEERKWRTFPVSFEISSSARMIGNTIGPYFFEKE